MERDVLLAVWGGLRMSISTHTLTWSVTAADRYIFESFFISTHTLTWSVTVYRDVLTDS